MVKRWNIVTEVEVHANTAEQAKALVQNILKTNPAVKHFGHVQYDDFGYVDKEKHGEDYLGPKP